MFFSLTGNLLASEQPSSVIDVKAAIDDAPPYRIINGKEVSGIYVDIYELVMKQLGAKTAYYEVPFPRAFRLMQSGAVDVMLGPIKTEERSKYIDFSIPAFPPVAKLFLVNHEKNVIRKYADFAGKVIGTQRGSYYFKRFDDDKNLEKVPLNNYAQALHMLKADRLDVVIIPEPIAALLLKNSKLSFIRSPLIMPGVTCYIAISKHSPLKNYVSEIKAALATVKESGAYDEVVNKYLH